MLTRFRSTFVTVAISTLSVEPQEQIDASGTRAVVTYRITPGEQARVDSFNINITGFDPASSATVAAAATQCAVHAGSSWPKTSNVYGMRSSPREIWRRNWSDPRVERDAETKSDDDQFARRRLVPKLTLSSRTIDISEKTQRELLPVKREGNIDLSAIEEGARRLRNKLQEEGYFFAEITPVCSVTPPLTRVTRQMAVMGSLRQSGSWSAQRAHRGDSVSD